MSSAKTKYIYLFDYQIGGIFESIFDEFQTELGLQLKVHFKGCPQSKLAYNYIRLAKTK
jgi:hypothetical protein